MIYSQMIRNCKTLKIPLPDLLLNFSHLLSDYLLLTCRLFNQQFSVKIQRDSSVARASFDYAQDRLFRMTLRKSPVVILTPYLIRGKNLNSL